MKNNFDKKFVTSVHLDAIIKGGKMTTTLNNKDSLFINEQSLLYSRCLKNVNFDILKHSNQWDRYRENRVPMSTLPTTLNDEYIMGFRVTGNYNLNEKHSYRPVNGFVYANSGSYFKSDLVKCYYDKDFILYGSDVTPFEIAWRDVIINRLRSIAETFSSSTPTLKIFSYKMKRVYSPNEHMYAGNDTIMVAEYVVYINKGEITYRDENGDVQRVDISGTEHVFKPPSITGWSDDYSYKPESGSYLHFRTGHVTIILNQNLRINLQVPSYNSNFKWEYNDLALITSNRDSTEVFNRISYKDYLTNSPNLEYRLTNKKFSTGYSGEILVPDDIWPQFGVGDYWRTDLDTYRYDRFGSDFKGISSLFRRDGILASTLIDVSLKLNSPLGGYWNLTKESYVVTGSPSDADFITGKFKADDEGFKELMSLIVARHWTDEEGLVMDVYKNEVDFSEKTLSLENDWSIDEATNMSVKGVIKSNPILAMEWFDTTKFLTVLSPYPASELVSKDFKSADRLPLHEEGLLTFKISSFFSEIATTLNFVKSKVVEGIKDTTTETSKMIRNINRASSFYDNYFEFFMFSDSIKAYITNEYIFNDEFKDVLITLETLLIKNFTSVLQTWPDLDALIMDPGLPFVAYAATIKLAAQSAKDQALDSRIAIAFSELLVSMSNLVSSYGVTLSAKADYKLTGDQDLDKMTQAEKDACLLVISKVYEEFFEGKLNNTGLIFGSNPIHSTASEKVYKVLVTIFKAVGSVVLGLASNLLGWVGALFNDDWRNDVVLVKSSTQNSSNILSTDFLIQSKNNALLKSNKSSNVWCSLFSVEDKKTIQFLLARGQSGDSSKKLLVPGLGNTTIYLNNVELHQPTLDSFDDYMTCSINVYLSGAKKTKVSYLDLNSICDHTSTSIFSAIKHIHDEGLMGLLLSKYYAETELNLLTVNTSKSFEDVDPALADDQPDSRIPGLTTLLVVSSVFLGLTIVGRTVSRSVALRNASISKYEMEKKMNSLVFLLKDITIPLLETGIFKANISDVKSLSKHLSSFDINAYSTVNYAYTEADKKIDLILVAGVVLTAFMAFRSFKVVKGANAFYLEKNYGLSKGSAFKKAISQDAAGAMSLLGAGAMLTASKVTEAVTNIFPDADFSSINLIGKSDKVSPNYDERILDGVNKLLSDEDDSSSVQTLFNSVNVQRKKPRRRRRF